MIYKYENEDVFNFPAYQLFEIIIDIEKYSEFIPWCTAAHIIERSDNRITADLLATFKGIKRKYTSEVVFKPPIEKQKGLIEVKAIKGLFKHLYNTWELIPQSNNQTIVKFYIEFEFQYSFFQAIFSTVYKHAQEKIISAFKDRALITLT